MAQSGPACQSGHKTVKVVLHMGIQWKKMSLLEETTR